MEIKEIVGMYVAQVLLAIGCMVLVLERLCPVFTVVKNDNMGQKNFLRGSQLILQFHNRKGYGK